MNDMSTEQFLPVSSSAELSSNQEILDNGIASQFAFAIARREAQQQSARSQAKGKKIGRLTRLAAVGAILSTHLVASLPAFASKETDPVPNQPEPTQIVPDAIERYSAYLPTTFNKGAVEPVTPVAPGETVTSTPPIEATPTPTATETPPETELILGGDSQLVKDLEPFTSWVRATQVANNSPVPVNGSYRAGQTFHNLSAGDELWWAFDSQNTIPQGEQKEYEGSIEPEARVIANSDRPLRLQRRTPNNFYLNNYGADVNQPLVENQPITYYFKGTSKRLSPDAVSTINIGYSVVARLDHKQNGDLFVRIGSGIDQRTDLNVLIGNIAGDDIDLGIQINANHQDILVLKADGNGGYTPFQDDSQNDRIIHMPQAFKENYLAFVLEGQGLMDLEINEASAQPGALPDAVTPETLLRENQRDNGIYQRTGQKIGVSGTDSSGPFFVRFLTEGNAQYVDFLDSLLPSYSSESASHYSYEYEEQLFNVLRVAGIEADVPIYVASNEISNPSQEQVLRHMDNLLEFGSNQAVVLKPFDQNGVNQIDRMYFERFGCSGKNDCLSKIVKFINNDNADPRWNPLQEGEPRQIRPVNIASPRHLAPGAFNAFFSAIDAVITSGGHIATIDAEVSEWTPAEYQAFATKVTERGLKLRPRKVATSQNGTIEEYTSVSVANSADIISYAVGQTQTDSAIFYRDPLTNMTRFNDHERSETSVSEQSPYERVVRSIDESKIK